MDNMHTGMNTVAPDVTTSSAHVMGHPATMDPHAGHNMDTNMDMSGMHAMDMMKMYFHTGVDETVLFYQWKISTVGGMVGSCVGIFFIALMYEGLKVLREHLLRKYSTHSRYSSYALSNGQSSQESTTVMVDSPTNRRHRFCSWPHFLQTFLHMVQVLISYMLMLIFMSYNIWLCLAVVLGAGTGYLAFGWHKSVIVDINEHCH